MKINPCKRTSSSVGSKHKLVIEDGHNELKTGFTTTDAGAPEWGNFDFTIDIEKKRVVNFNSYSV
jgi:hypothetical protein